MMKFYRFYIAFFLCFVLHFVSFSQEVSKQALVAKMHNLLNKEFPNQNLYNVSISDSLITVSQALPDTLFYGVVKKLGLVFLERGRQVSAIDLFVFAQKYFESLTEKSTTTWLQFSDLKIVLGAAYEEIGMWNKAMENYHEVLKIIEAHHFEGSKARVYNNIGAVHFNRREFDKAEFYVQKAVGINHKLLNKKELFNNYNNLGAIYMVKQNYTKALEYAFLALQQVNKKESPHAYYFVHTNIARIYMAQEDFEIALSYLQKAMDYQEKMGYDRDLVSTYGLISQIYAQQHKNEKAKEYLLKAEDLANGLTNNFLLEEVYGNLVNYYASIKDYEKAYQYQKKLIDIRDSLDMANSQKKISDVEFLYETERKEKEHKLLLNQLSLEKYRIQKQSILSISLIALVLAVFSTLWYRSVSKGKVREAHLVLAEKQKLLHEQEKHILEEKEKELEQTIEQRNRELTSKVIYLVKNNEFIMSIVAELRSLLLEMENKDIRRKEHVRQILAKLRQQSNTGSWEEFKFYFEQVHHSFYENLLNKYPDLTAKDLRLCAFLRLGLSTKEISAITFREIRSIDSARNRLRKKMNLSSEENLTEFLVQF
ncbi:MAG: tetratricopeptide repeat protein [Bacteroidales bacterium]